MKNLKELHLNSVKLEDINGISELKNLEKLVIKNDSLTNIDELLKIEKLKELSIDTRKIYDRRKLKDLKDKGLLPNLNENEIEGELSFIINPKKFTLPDIYNGKGEKFDLLDEKNELGLMESSGHPYTWKHIEIFKTIKNFIKKNEDRNIFLYI